MEEHTFAVIPGVTILGILGPKRYGMVVTNRRCILVEEYASNPYLGGVFGGVAGALFADAVAKRRVVDYDRTSPDVLARDPKNLEVPFANIRKLVFKGNRPYNCYLRIDYVRSDGKRKRIDAYAYPPSEVIRQRKSEGISRRRVVQDLAGWVHRVLREALPADVASRAEWKL